MQKFTITFIVCLILLINNVMAQSEDTILGRLKIGVELGSHYMNTNSETPPQVRQSNWYPDRYEYYRQRYYYSDIISVTYVSLKPEFQFSVRTSLVFL